MSDVEIRAGRPADADALVAMMGELAASEGLERPRAVTAEALRALLAGPDPRLRAWLAWAGRRPIGYLTYTIGLWPWDAGDRVFVDDVFVREEARGLGVGTRLMRAVGSVAADRGLVVRWEVRPENAAALAFYRRLGAETSDTVVCRWRPDPWA